MADDSTLIANWPHQIASIEALRQGIRDGHNAQLLMAPTGSGKTRIGAHLLNECNKNYNRAAFVVDRTNLVDQTSAVLDSFGIPHGIIQADHWRRRPQERIQVCSAQTIEKRGFFPELKLLIVDECHDTRKATIQLIKNRSDLRVVGLSASPFKRGLGQIYTRLVNVCTTDDLIASGVLVPLQFYAARSMDMSGAKVVAGEWSDKDVEQRGMVIIGDIVSEWVAKTMLHFGGPVKTIAFSATVDHGAELCRRFQAAGYNFQQISYKSGSDERRAELIAEFRKPDSEIDGLVSCEVFTKGFDVPDIKCGIGARPYRKSLSSHIQQLGRVMRSSPGKTFGLWLDHCGNVFRFKEDADDIFANGLHELDDGGARDSKVRSEPTEFEKKQMTCSCGFVLPPKSLTCPACGKERVRQSLVQNAAGVMEQLDPSKKGAKKAEEPFLKDRRSVWRQLCSLSLDRKKGDEAAAKKFALMQFKNIYGRWPNDDFSSADIEPPTKEVIGRVQHNLIKFFKGRATHAV